MKYERIERATFLERPNRFIAYARIAGKQETIHVKNTGRCAELLVPEAEIFVQESDNPERKTKWDLIGVRKGDRLINMDSQIPNKVVEEWLRAGNLFLEPVAVRPETTYGNSRFDFYVESGEKKAFIEVKGVTLEEDGVVRFPDAPRAGSKAYGRTDPCKKGRIRCLCISGDPDERRPLFYTEYGYTAGIW